MCSEYGPLATLTVCTERAIRQLLLTVRNSATVLDMTERKRRWGRGEAGARLLNKALLVEASPRGRGLQRSSLLPLYILEIRKSQDLAKDFGGTASNA